MPYPLDSWEVTDSPLAFDSPLSSATDGPIPANGPVTFTRTITEPLPSADELQFVGIRRHSDFEFARW